MYNGWYSTSCGDFSSLRQIILEREGCEILANMRKHAQSPTMLQVLPGGEFVLCEGM